MPGSRVVKSAKDHRVTIKTDTGCFLRLIPGRNRAYLWIGDGPHDRHHTTISGPKALRALANAILKELPDADA